MTLTAKRALVIAAIALTGCSTDKILQVDRPDIIDPNGLGNPAGVTALHAGVIGDLAAYMDAAVGINAAVGLFTDEIRFGATPPEIKQFDTGRSSSRTHSSGRTIATFNSCAGRPIARLKPSERSTHRTPASAR